MTESIRIAARDGLSLEAEVDLAEDARACVVFCHPHPRMGGTMSAPLLIALRDDFVQRGLGVVRFNYRGVGASDGTSGLGEDEVADALGALDFAGERAPGLPVALLGWSFGGAVAIRAAAVADVRGCAAIAPAVQRKEGVTAGLPPPEELGLSVPLLVVIGANDDQIAPEAAERWAAGVERARFVKMSGANHFFWAKYSDLAALCGDWLEEVLA